jgi:hypothetical protein
MSGLLFAYLANTIKRLETPEDLATNLLEPASDREFPACWINHEDWGFRMQGWRGENQIGWVFPWIIFVKAVCYRNLDGP